ncbi:MAG TPA: hypothetical protein VMG62_05205 [Solirubrobacteraceae bacterium]|nr:hypothetical protein [Solirubrobacteraceae bacterium]
MNIRGLVVGVLAGVALASPSVLSIALPQASSAAAPVHAHAACTNAVIAGEHKCIARGEFCKHTARAERDYERYGLHCTKRDANGRYHLT